MNSAQQGWFSWLASTAKLAFWLILIYLLVKQVSSLGRIEAARTDNLEQLQQQRGSRVIAMIHRQEAVTFLGIPITNYISIDDSEAVLRAIRSTEPEQPIDFILHTPGGLVLAASQIAKALVDHKGKVTVFVPHYAMSGGTLIALAADEVVMDPNAVLGPVDPQIGDMPAASIIKLLEVKKPAEISDEMLILADVAEKARMQVTDFVTSIVLKNRTKPEAAELAKVLTDGRWTHDFPITVETARELGLPVSTDVPRQVYELMKLYPQAGAGRPSVLYVPMRPAPRDRRDTADVTTPAQLVGLDN